MICFLIYYDKRFNIIDFHSLLNGSFTFQARDNNGCLSTIGTITINVYAAPIVQNASFESYQNVIFTASLAGYVAGGAAPYTFNLVSQPSEGVVDLQANGVFTFTPVAGSLDSASFTYMVVDENGCQSNTATALITFKQPITSTFLNLYDTLYPVGS